MKTTIDIAEGLLAEAKGRAAAEGTTLRALVEDGLRRVLAERGQGSTFRLRRASFRGRGLQPPLEGAPWTEVRDLAYSGRGS